MKQADILKVIAHDLGTSDLAEVNKLLKAKTTPEVKYRITGKKLGHQGYNGVIKNITADGVKVFNVNKVNLIKFEDIERFEKSKPKVERHTSPKKVEEKKPTPIARKSFSEEENTPKTEKFRKKPSGKSGSAFIPKSKKPS